MESNLFTSDPSSPTAPPPAKKGLLRKVLGMRFLVISIVVHLLFGLGAAVWVVTSYTAQRKLTFKGGPPSPNRSTRAIEHQVQMAKKQQTMSAPTMNKRITTTGVSKVALPAMPAMPQAAAAPAKMAGVGGTALSLGASAAMGSGAPAGGSLVSMFGLRELKGGGLVGTFYDLKQDRGRKATGMDVDKYVTVLQDFVGSGWDESKLKTYFQAPNKLSTTQVFIPFMSATEGPKAFQVERDVQPRLWVVHYQGTVTAPESGSYHFVGGGDDVLAVRFNEKDVLDGGLTKLSKSPALKAQTIYRYQWANGKGPAICKGEAFAVERGKSYPIEILIGEKPGGYLAFCLFLEQQNGTYQKDASGSPVLPIFRLAAGTLGPGDFPPYDPKGPIWRGEPPKPTKSVFKSELPGH